MTLLEKIKLAAEKRTKGEWKYERCGEYLWRVFNDRLLTPEGKPTALEVRSAFKPDIEFIALMGTHVEKLIRVVDAARSVVGVENYSYTPSQQISKLRETLKGLEAPE